MGALETWEPWPRDRRFAASNLGQVTGVRGHLLSPYQDRRGYLHVQVPAAERQLRRHEQHASVAAQDLRLLPRPRLGLRCLRRRPVLGLRRVGNGMSNSRDDLIAVRMLTPGKSDPSGRGGQE